MLIALYDPETFELQNIAGPGALSTLSWGDPAKRFRDISWVDPLDNEQLEAQGVPARIIVETEPPEVGYQERADYTAERQPDGTWLQVWNVVPTPLADLKQIATARANQAAEEKISTLELARGLINGAPRPRTVNVINKLDEIRTRIDAATTGAEIKAILDELEAF
jgi:hypothetical protein